MPLKSSQAMNWQKTENNPIPSQTILNRENKEIVTTDGCRRGIYIPLEQPLWAVCKQGKHRKTGRRERKTEQILRKKRDLASGDWSRLRDSFSSCCTQGLAFQIPMGSQS